ncbi:hypothetical protein BMS3Abin01_00032 [bacterium BMS3Abin01]|nr:hypothetical protein BMS3Abin01_00032 [bacterium BMS3Abin01]HDZ59630.1 DUF192 domain-containing protein [Actinomycetota bacterium]
MLLILVPALCGCASDDYPAAATSTVSSSLPQKVVFRSAGGDTVLTVEVADTSAGRARGLMGRTSLDAENGMIFVWQLPVREEFWMKDTLIPLSIAFISVDGAIIDIQDMEPETVISHVPPQPYIMAIEANQGYFEQHGIRIGDRAELTGGA